MDRDDFRLIGAKASDIMCSSSFTMPRGVCFQFGLSVCQRNDGKTSDVHETW